MCKFWYVMVERKQFCTLALPEYLLPSIWVPKAGGGFTDCMYIYPKHVVRRSVPPFLDAFAKLRKSTISFVMSANCLVCLSVWNNSAPPRRIFTRFPIGVFFREYVEISQVYFKRDENNGHFTWRPMKNYDKISLNSFWNEAFYRQNFILFNLLAIRRNTIYSDTSANEDNSFRNHIHLPKRHFP